MNRLAEIFEKVNRIKLNEDASIYQMPQEKDIVADILSMNEDVNSILNKLVAYGKKGLLTMAIVFAVAQGLQAQQKADVINTGLEYTKDANRTEFYAACVGYVNGLNAKERTDLDRKKAIIEARVYFENLRDNKQAHQLSPEGKIVVDFVMKELMHKTAQEIKSLATAGSNLTTSQ
jgi:hypothetical protein